VKLLHVIGSLSPADGGPPESVRQMAKFCPSIDVDVEIVCQDPPASAFLSGLPFQVHALGQRWLGRYGLSPRLWRWLHENAGRFDGIVMNGLWVFPNVAVRFAAQRAGVPYVVFPHGSLDPWFNKTYPFKHLKKILYWPIQYRVLRDARAVLFTTQTEQELAATSFHPNRWNGHAISYGISEPGGDPASQTEAFFRSWPQLRGRRYLLFLSRIHEKKGCDLLLHAFAHVASQYPDVDLVIAGPDQSGLQASLRQIAAQQGVASRIHWPGMLTGDIKWGALRAAEVFVLPSHQENFGIVVVESLVAGRPVLISNQVNIYPDIVADGTGLVEEDTLEGTERLLRRWLELSPKEREAMAARTYASFARRYSISNLACGIKDILQSAEAPSASGDGVLRV